MKTISSFGKAMAQIMKSRMAFHDVTQAEMAEAIGVSQSQLSKILRGERTIDLESFEAFCESIGEYAVDLVKDGEVIAERIRETKPDQYQPATRISFVDDNSRIPVFAPAAGHPEEELVNATLARALANDQTLAAYRSGHKQEYIDGDAGPDWDEPA